MKVPGRTVCAAAGLALATALSACGSGGGSATASSGPIVIGASIPLTGPLAGFGYFEKWGYQHAVNVVNNAGGIKIDGVKRKVKLIILDDQTNPNTTVNNVQQLITQDHVDALLGSCTDSLVEPGALIANRMGVPMVTPCAATNTFGATAKWTWAWDLFFNSENLTETPFNTADELGLKAKTNSKVAIIHSNGKNENIIGTQEWPAWAKKHGWKVVYNTAVPPTQTQFTSSLQAAKAAGADMLLVVIAPPGAIALRKQMVSVGYNPKILVEEEGGEPLQFAQALGKLANGVMVGGYWDPSFPFPGAKQLEQEFEAQTAPDRLTAHRGHGHRGHGPAPGDCPGGDAGQDGDQQPDRQDQRDVRGRAHQVRRQSHVHPAHGRGAVAERQERHYRATEPGHR